MQSDTVLQRDPCNLSTELDGETVLMNIESGKYFTLDRVGSEIWNLLSEPRPLADLLATLVDRFDGDPEVIRSETLSFVESLAEKGIVRRV